MNGAAAANPNLPPAAATSLAPGFRFHPTDEELVSYYLKRKVAGRPLRVDAIAEVDLYKCEPWDLPARSRIRSRDVEWYFFSPLDRKYSNRSRTNRATAQGYWKTTGKDRSIRNGPRQVGMKKTLVFHVGRAPRGKRTNWVMHEYRIEEEEEDERPQAGAAPQDAYVVCRIFQKCGAGPQNGAQYGAPFMEEEWEDEAADLLAVMPVGGEDEYVDAGNSEYLQYNDFEQTQTLESHQDDVQTFVGDPIIQGDVNNVGDTAIQEGGNCLDDTDALLNELFAEPNFIDELVDSINEPGEYSDLTLVDDMQRKHYAGDFAQVSPIQNDEFVEMNDLSDIFNFECPSNEDSIGYPLRNYHEKISPDGRDENSHLHKLLEVDEFFGTSSHTLEQPESIQADPVDDNTNLQISDFVHPAGDDVVFYDASDDILDSTGVKFPQPDEFLKSPMAERSDFEMLDDIMAYYDATDNNLSCKTTILPEEIGFLDFSAMSQDKVAKKVIDMKSTGDASTSATFEPDNHFKDINEDFTVASAPPDNGGSDKTSIGKRLVNMLGSISAPPAFAAEIPSGSGKSVEEFSPSHSTSSIHVTTGLISIHDLAMSSSTDNWPLRKSGDLGFLLSYSFTDGVVRNCACKEPITNITSGALTVALRGGFSLFCLSAIILGLSYKLGMCIYGR